MILSYNGTDLSQYVTKYGFTETPRVIEGVNKGTSLSGVAIPDVVAIKYDITIPCRPLSPAQVGALWTLVNSQLADPYLQLTYSRADGTSRTMLARISLGGAEKVMETSEHTLYEGLVLKFTEK